jgi:hypothetical protein
VGLQRDGERRYQRVEAGYVPPARSCHLGRNRVLERCEPSPARATAWLRGGSFNVKPRAAAQIDQRNKPKFNVLTGAANRIRTCDPVITNDVLYQLSYCGGPCGAFSNGLKTLARDIGQRPAWQEKR